jgi:hypothetical protein
MLHHDWLVDAAAATRRSQLNNATPEVRRD